jgi:hypothetical protein
VSPNLARLRGSFEAASVGASPAGANEAQQASGLHGQVPTRLAPARRYLYPMVLRRVWGKKQRGLTADQRHGFSCRHEGRRHARLAPRAGSPRRGAAPAPGTQASTMPRRLYAERRLLRPAVAQRAAVDRKAWIGPTKPADSGKSVPALSIPAILGRVLINGTAQLAR